MLSNEFDDIIKDFGHNILLIHKDSELQCSCWNEKRQEAMRDCPVCFGVGIVPSIEKHTVRSITLTIPQSLPNAVGLSSVGPIAYSSKAFYFRSNCKVLQGDLVVEVDWSATGKPIYNGGDISEVGYVDPLRFEQGQVAYHKVYVANKSIESNIRGVRIANSNGIKNYEIIREGQS